MSSARWSIMPSLSARCSIGVAVIAFLAGVLALQRCAQLPAAEWGWLGLVIVLLGWRYPVWQAPAWTAAGFWWAWWIAAAILAQELPAELEGKDLIAEGVIASLPAINDERSRFEFALERLGDSDHDLTLPDRIQLSKKDRERPEKHTGERWRFTVRLKRPHGFMNPGGFDYEGWLFRHRLRATGYVRPDGEARRLAATPYEYPLLRARQALADEMDLVLVGWCFAGFVVVLVF